MLHSLFFSLSDIFCESRTGKGSLSEPVTLASYLITFVPGCHLLIQGSFAMAEPLNLERKNPGQCQMSYKYFCCKLGLSGLQKSDQVGVFCTSFLPPGSGSSAVKPRSTNFSPSMGTMIGISSKTSNATLSLQDVQDWRILLINRSTPIANRAAKVKQSTHRIPVQHIGNQILSQVIKEMQ